ncbi:MAG: hypothetical protein H7X97_12205, partial [Opitutaceae bacterium]|nr:hypothetical protein [Verrucomicrobiales bacterium]
MGRLLWLITLLFLGSLSGIVASAQTYELRYTANTPYNLQSTNGVPLSNVRGTPPGSDGRANNIPTPPTTNQFQSVVTFSSGVVPNAAGLLAGQSLVPGNTVSLNLPRTASRSAILVRARVGAPFVSQNISFLFGAIIPPPETDEYGVLLSLVNDTIVPPRAVTYPDDYWFPEPFTSNGHTNSGYYWSPHAQSVFAINPGPLQIIWRRSLPGLPFGIPPNVGTNAIAGTTYTIYTNRYLVSGSSVKVPRQMYWTERSYRATGKPVAVPSTRVGAVNIVYNNNFTRTVTNEFVAPGQSSPTDGGTNQTLAELRTLWYDSQLGQILAYNTEGRAFLELLGDVREDGVTRRHLGFEVVDVVRQPNPKDVTTELGDRLTAYKNGDPDDSHLFPEPIQVVGSTFAYRHNINGSERVEYFATRETRNLNDLQVHWLEEGIEGLKWPLLLVRYKLIWPPDSARYSHYVRPLVGTEGEAKLTAVPLPTANAPLIDYQDPLDQPRGKLTDKFEYYSILTTNFPAHRALVRYTSGDYVAFERVFSWLDVTLKNGSFSNTVTTNLTAWNPTNSTLQFVSDQVAPRVVNLTVNVGDRIGAPISEIGAFPDTNYLAGYLLETNGNSFHPNAYVNPFVSGFDLANLGAIIPVNAIPGKNFLDVWWFRKNAVDIARGFKNTHWPAVIGRYTLQWPTAPSEIVLASNDGSGGLPSLQAKGRIYFQNDVSMAGYNPNEEHALMQGGQAYGLRDDLNVTNSVGYSSAPFVLLDYVESDGRPAIRAFKVLREKPATGQLFDYTVAAATILQPPMPLPLLEKPLAPPVVGQPPKSLNREILAWTVSSGAPVSSAGFNIWTLSTSDRHYFKSYQAVALQNATAVPPTPTWFYPTNVDATGLTGFLSSRRPYRLSLWTGDLAVNPNRWRFGLNDFSQLAISSVTVLTDPTGRSCWPVTVTETNRVLGYVEVDFAAVTPEPAKIAAHLILPLNSGASGQFNGFRVALEPLPENVSDTALRSFYSAFTFQDRKGNEWVYRGPHNPADQASMVMQFYYKTLPGFFFPSLALNTQPPVGTVTPYLRARNPDGSFVGDPVRRNANLDTDGDGQSLGIIYRPEWPDETPVLQMAETLTLPKRGLPSVRGQTSLEILYQQPQVSGGVQRKAAVLHDPTREKAFALGAASDVTRLGAIPDSVKTSTFRGKTYFPNLPPHLVERFFLDPNRGQSGSLVFRGEFVDAPVGDKYVLLNVLGGQDLATLKGLAEKEPQAKKDLWNSAIDGLSTAMEKFIEDTGKPGTYKANGQPSVKGPVQLAEVTDDDVAVDSYAMTAVGPGIGYVTLIAGNGLAFTPIDEPVTVKVIRVSDTLYRGEVNIIESSNPLNEKLTMQQVVDLAGQVEAYSFEWKIAAPVDGLPPTVYQNTPAMLMANGTWKHARFPLTNDSPSTISRAASSRISQDVGTSVAPVTKIGYDSVALQDGKYWFFVSSPHYLVVGNQVIIRTSAGAEVFGTVHSLTTPAVISVDINPGQPVTLTLTSILELYERPLGDRPQSVVFREFTQPAGVNYSQVWLSMDLDAALGVRLYIDGQPLVAANFATDNTPSSSAPAGLTPLNRTYSLASSSLAGGVRNPDGTRTHRVVAELFSSALPGAFQDFNVRVEAFAS